MIKQVLVCKRGNRLFLLRYGFGYLTTIYKFATWDSWQTPHPKTQPFFQFRPQEKKECIICRSNLVQNCFPFVFVVN